MYCIRRIVSLGLTTEGLEPTIWNLILNCYILLLLESSVGDQPGPSGLAYTNVSRISSSSEIVCIDDEDDVMIVISDSEPD